MNIPRILTRKIEWRHKPAYLWYLLTKPQGPVGVMTRHDSDRFGFTVKTDATRPHSFSPAEAHALTTTGAGLSTRDFPRAKLAMTVNLTPEHVQPPADRTYFPKEIFG